MEEFTVTVDTFFLANAITAAMQLQDKIGDESFLSISNMEIDEDGHLVLYCTMQEETLN